MNNRLLLFYTLLLPLLMSPLPRCATIVAEKRLGGEEECTLEVPHREGSAPPSDDNVEWTRSAWMMGVTWEAPLKGSSRGERSLQEGDDAKDAAHGGEDTSQYFKCFVDKAKENTGVKPDDVARWVDPQHNSCYCSEENTEPCSMEDVSNSKFINQLMRTEICELNERGNKHNLFIALQHHSIIKCSNVESTEEKINHMDLYNYCKSGLPAWDNKHFYNYLHCDTVRNKNGRRQDGVGAEASCAELCEDIKVLCNSNNSQFYSFEMCIKYYEINHFTTEIFNRVFKMFQESCSYVDPTNRGLVLCKHKHIPCEFSEWSDWSTCSRTCKEGTYDTEAIRSRKRYLVKQVKYSGKACNIVVNGKNKLLDVEYCDDDVPLCSSIHEPTNNSPQSNPSPDNPTTEQIYNPPFVIPLNEIQKANMLNDLNQPDADVINENFVHNDSEVLTECIVTDMGQFEHLKEYNEKIKSCACPAYHTPCYFKDIYKSDYWKESFDRHCAKHPTLNVITADFFMVSCDNSVTIRKKEVAINTYLAMTFDCRSPTFQYLFCSKSNESSTTNIFYIMFTCTLAFISALYVIHLLISERDKWAFFITGVVGSKRPSRTDHHATGPSPGSSSDEVSDKASDEDSNAPSDKDSNKPSNAAEGKYVI
ncbi:hypothetical protein AK88_00784 [Plasmodium fragile]|uniref:Thrombospondin-related protein 1 n=1 Tax=Plasmodium fragile TaxID=5857 RepID=A0A0D9QRM7_PLAFR|nr:uncharacterized protein AK88_00784 [Plasmodium fragile]KJP89573.1 hypothetical protein AK88_00784 [Plasmodium fragile]